MNIGTTQEHDTVDLLFRQAIATTAALVAAGDDYTKAQLILEAGKPEAGRLGRKLAGHKRALQDWQIACEVQDLAPKAIDRINAELSELREELRTLGYVYSYKVSDLGGVRAELSSLHDDLPQVPAVVQQIPVSRFD